MGGDSGETGSVGEREGVSGKSLHLLTFVVNLKLLFKKMKSFENCEDIAFMETLFIVIKR